MAHTITDIEFDGRNLAYRADRKYVETWGEFACKDGIYTHTHIFDDDQEVEFTFTKNA